LGRFWGTERGEKRSISTTKSVGSERWFVSKAHVLRQKKDRKKGGGGRLKADHMLSRSGSCLLQSHGREIAKGEKKRSNGHKEGGNGIVPVERTIRGGYITLGAEGA